MTAQHTKGSWAYEKFISSEGHVTFEIFRANALRESLGRVDIAYSQVFSSYTDESVDVQESNARVMAAGPDLLDALQKMVEIAELTMGWLPTPEGADGPLIQAHAAIAKATGGAA